MFNRLPILFCLFLLMSCKQEPSTLSVWLPYWNWDEGIIKTKMLACRLNTLHPFIYDFENEDKIRLAPGTAANPVAVLAELKMTCPQMLMVPTLVNDLTESNGRISLKDRQIISRNLADSGKRAEHVQQIVELVSRNRWDGIDIDYENLQPGDLKLMALLVQELRAKLSARNPQAVLTLTLEPKWVNLKESATLRDIADNVDRLQIMAYCYSCGSGTAGPVAPVSWVKQLAETVIQIGIPRAKVAFALASFQGYDFEEGSPREKFLRGPAIQRLMDEGHSSRFIEQDGAERITYFQNNLKHDVWYEGEKSVMSKIRMLRSVGIRHFILWNVSQLPEPFLKTLHDLMADQEKNRG